MDCFGIEKFNCIINVSRKMDRRIENNVYQAAYIIKDCMDDIYKYIGCCRNLRSGEFYSINDAIDIIKFFHCAISNPKLELNNSINILANVYLLTIAKNIKYNENDDISSVINKTPFIENISLREVNFPENISSVFNLHDKYINNNKKYNNTLKDACHCTTAIASLMFATGDFANILKDMAEKSTTDEGRVNLILIYKKWISELSIRLENIIELMTMTK